MPSPMLFNACVHCDMKLRFSETEIRKWVYLYCFQLRVELGICETNRKFVLYGELSNLLETMTTAEGEG